MLALDNIAVIFFLLLSRIALDVVDNSVFEGAHKERLGHEILDNAHYPYIQS